ncbi:MAG: dTMP kinase [Cyanobacteria bacterium P01_F01_bin.150]
MNGHLIVFEGVEGCGKTTQIQKLYDWLSYSKQFTKYSDGSIDVQCSEYPIQITREPGGTALGQIIRGIVLGEDKYQLPADIDYRAELLLYSADRAQHVSEYILPYLKQGVVVLCDRYTDSTIAYQGYGRGIDRDLIEQLNAIATNGLQSDLTLWLDLDVEEGLARTRKRGDADRMEKSTLDFHHRVQRGFQDLAIAYPKRIARVDAQGHPDQVAQRIQGIVAEKFQQWDLALDSTKGL